MTHHPLPLAAALEQDGFAVARNVLRDDDLRLARAGVDAGRGRPGPFHRVLSRAGEPVTESDLFCLGRVAELHAIVYGSPLPALAAAALGVGEVVLLEDQWFVSEAGGGTPSPWHQDDPYHPLDAPFLTTWLPLDPLPPGFSLRVVPGSHRGPVYAPIEFSASQATLVESGPDVLGAVPDIDAGALPFVEPDVRPGDVLLLDSRTLHAVAGGPPVLSRRLSLRWARPGTRIRARPWATAAFWDELGHGLVEGDLVGGAAFPTIVPV